MKWIFPILTLFWVFPKSGYSSHIVGGEIFLEYLRGNTYEIGLILYYDQVNASFNLIDEEIVLGVFGKSDNRLKKSFSIPVDEVKNIRYSNSKCVADSIKTLKITYLDQVNLFITEFSDPAGYYVSWERCCRNNIVTNMIDPGSTGMVFYMEFPSLSEHPFNSSPRFTPVNGDYVCKNRLFEYPYQCNDEDGDSLVYDLVIPLAGHTGFQNPHSDLLPGPYPYVFGFYPMPGAPPISIDPLSGLLSVNPSLNGLYSFTVRCQEYRAGKKIGEVRREFQLPVANCPPNPSPEFEVFNELGPVSAGDTLIAQGRDSLCFAIKAWDASPLDNLTFTIDPINFENFLFPVFFPSTGETQGVNDTLEIKFCWPKCYLAEEQIVFEFDFIVEDDACPIPNKQSKRYKLISIPEENFQPVIDIEYPEYNASVGQETIIRIYATDQDLEDVLTLNFLGESFGEFPLLYEFDYTVGPGWAEGEFKVSPDCKNLNTGFFNLGFGVKDNSCRENTKDSSFTLLKVQDFIAGEKDFIPPPNIITANYDGINDFFSLPQTSDGKCEKGAFQKAIIFNRWGDKVFESASKDFRWYAEDVPPGDYFYQIEFQGFSYTGFLNILK